MNICNFLKFNTVITCIILSGCGSGGGNDDGTTYLGSEAFYSFDEQSGSEATNARFDEYHGEIIGASRVEGKVNSALYFGYNLPSYVNFTKDYQLTLDFPEDTIGIEAWVKFETLSPNETYNFFGSYGGGTKNFALSVKESQFEFVLYTPYESINLLDTNFVFGVDTWYHIAFTYNGSDSKFYINGELNTSSSIIGPVNEIYNTLYLGGYKGNSFPGYIDELLFTSELRTANQIKEYYESTK
tara:strand:- start:476 stop:1201 length:726 start_codon:yes stop_codon:yes gene_type:complete